MKNNYIKAVIVDSGLNSSRKFSSNNKVSQFKFKNKKGIISEKPQDNIGHGTAVSSIIDKNVTNTHLLMVRLFYEDYKVDESNLINLLKYIYKNLNVDLIHLSNGITRCNKLNLLKKICNKLIKKGVIIISAFDNGGQLSYPAAFSNVIGVDWNEKCSNPHDYIYLKNNLVNILGTGSILRVPWKNEKYKNVSGSSFAAPYITSKIIQFLKKGIKKLSDILEELEKNSWKTVKYHEKNERLMKQSSLAIDRAILFPINKEMHSLVRFSNMLSFDIFGVYDHRLFKNIGKKLSEFGCTNEVYKKMKIIPQKNIDWEKEFDTVIIGHTSVISSALKKDILNEILKKCVKYKKNIYSFGSLENYKEKVNKIKKNNCFAKYPNSKWNIPLNLGKLYGIPKPVIGIYGTSPKQGKFTLQLILRKIFKEQGYKVGQLGTEPSSRLFGIDKVYPMGYKSNIKISGANAISVINKMMFEISRKNPDIIITGSQSQTVPHNMGNVGLYPIAQHEFLLGTEPDVCLLCINPYDDIKYIKRTIVYLEKYIKTKVLALSIFPVKKNYEWNIKGEIGNELDESKLQKRKKYYSSYFDNISINILGNKKDEVNMYNKCIDFFS